MYITTSAWSAFDIAFTFIVKLDRRSGEHNPLVVIAEVNSIISENAAQADVVIYTDVRHQRSAWAFTAHSEGKTVHGASGAFAMTSSSMTMEVMAVTGAFIWLESQAYTHVCILSDSLSTIRKIEAGSIHKQ